MFVEPLYTDKWDQIKSLLLNTLDLAPPLRSDFLNSQPVGSDIRQEVESLLAFENHADKLLDISAIEMSKDLFNDDAKDDRYAATGQEIGPYRLVSELGLGGLGAVYLAERKDERFEQRVAIKLLKREFNVDRMRRAFKRETDILARLKHPNIATIFDTGTTTDGIPYIVMEYVDGLPLDNYCESNRLLLKERLKLFNKVCQAVEYAHQNLIVHLDIKPSNILVTSDGVPKLLDFGISKSLGGLDGGGRATTIAAMTPEYASPEQIEGGRITTAADIYSLGVVLFKLLTGSYPYNFRTRSNGDILREITGSDPVIPSRCSGDDPPVARSQLKGDLDNIILKALSREPQERYSTVEGFSRDIWRFIDGEPVSARPATFFYRTSKIFKRNRVAFGAVAMVLVSIFVGAAAALWQADAARAQAQSALAAQNAAVAQSERSEKISKFMARVISYANPAWYAEGARSQGNARVIEVLDELGDKIDTEFAGQADVQSELHHKFAEVYHWVAKPRFTPDADKAAEFRRRARHHSLRALELRKEYYGDWHELVAKDLAYANPYLSDDPRKQAETGDLAVRMMRDTNPNNINFPYLLEGYSAELVWPGEDQHSEIYRQAVYPPTDETSIEIAERYEREALPLFRLHYPEGTAVIADHECRLAWTLAAQEKWADFDGHYDLCRKGAESSETVRRDLGFVDEKLAVTKR